MQAKILLKRKLRRFRNKYYYNPIFGWSIVVILIIFTISLFDLLLLPHINLNGNKIIFLEFKNNYKELGYKASYQGNDITNNVKVKGQVNSNKLGTYKIIYKVKTKYFIRKATRYIFVKDMTPPKIKIDNKSIYVCPNKKLVPKKIQVIDNYDGDISKNLKYKLKKDSITYYISDSNGNKTTLKKKIIYKDKYPPKIILNGDENIFLSVGEPYNEQGYNVKDNCDDKPKVIINGKVDINKPGKYNIKYTAFDKSKNKSTIIRHVIVSSINKPGVIYLTFDDGPHEGTTNIILDILKEEGVHATFFVTINGPDYLIKREYSEGHSIGLHTSSHNYSTIYSSTENFYKDLAIVNKRVKNITGKEFHIIRFPGGSSNTVSKKYSPGIMSTLTKDVVNKGYKYFDWNINSQDAEWGKHTSEEIKNNVINSLRKDKANIVLMHDIKPYTRDALRDIIKISKEQGYTFDVLTIDSAMVCQKVNN